MVTVIVLPKTTPSTVKLNKTHGSHQQLRKTQILAKLYLRDIDSLHGQLRLSSGEFKAGSRATHQNHIVAITDNLLVGRGIVRRRQGRIPLNMKSRRHEIKADWSRPP